MIRYFSLLVLFMLLNLTGCSDSVSPIPPTAKDPCTYTWTIDTLYYTPSSQYQGQTVIRNMWGVNDTLVYAVGHDAWYGYGAMWKYNGKEWTREKLLVSEGGPLGNADLFQVKGFNQNDIYAVGSSSTNVTGIFVYTAAIVHYNGIKWEQIQIPRGTVVTSIATTSPTQIFCGGENGQLFEFDGANWTVDTLKYTPYPSLAMSVSVLAPNTEGGVYLLGFQYNTQTGFEYNQFFKYNSKRLTVIDSSTSSFAWGGSSYWRSSLGHLFSCGKGGIFRLDGNKWINVYSVESLKSLVGTSEQHMFAISQSKIYFFDGISWKIVYTASTDIFTFVSAWCSDNELFISYSDGMKSYILHGK